MSTSTQRNRIGGLIAFLATAHFSHHVMTALLIPLLPFIRSEFGLNYAQTGVVTAMFTIAYGIFQLPGGWLADRSGPRYPLLASISGVALVGAAIGLSKNYTLLLGLLFLMGALGGGYHPAAAVIISRAVPPERRGRTLGLHIIGGSASYFIAPLLAAGLVAAVCWRGTYLGLSFPVFILGIAVFLVLDRRRRHAVYGQSENDRASGGAESRRTPLIITLFLLLTGIVGASIGSLIAFLPLYLVDERSFDPKLAAAMLAIIYSAGFWAAPLGGYLSDRLGRMRVMIVLGVLAGPIFAALLVVPSGLALALFLLAVGAIMFTKMPTAEAFIANAVKPERRATVLGIYFFSGVEGSALLTPLIGRSIDAYGFTRGFIATAVILLAMTLVTSILILIARERSVVSRGR